MKRYFFLFVLSLLSLGEGTSWVLDPETLKQTLPSEVTVEELTRVIQGEGIDVVFETKSPSVLWKGEKVSIALTSFPIAPYHLWISVEGRAKLEECSKEELQELYAAIWKGRMAIQEITGAEGFMIFTTDQPRRNKGNGWFGVEVIPSSLCGSHGIMDAVEKNIVNDYVFYNHVPVRKVIESSETITAIQEKLKTLEPHVIPEAPQEKWTQKLLHHTEALHQTLQWIHESLAKSGSLLEGTIPSPPPTEEKVHEISIDLDKCAFCNPKVIEKQLVCEWKEIDVLISHKPFSPFGNFLIIPKRHNSAFDLTQEEAASAFEAITALKKVLLKTSGRNNWICYLQDGPSIGQTVPHTHFQVMILPDPLKAAIAGLQHIHNQRPILSYEEARKRCEEIKSLLLTELQRN